MGTALFEWAITQTVELKKKKLTLNVREPAVRFTRNTF